MVCKIYQDGNMFLAISGIVRNPLIGLDVAKIIVDASAEGGTIISGAQRSANELIARAPEEMVALLLILVPGSRRRSISSHVKWQSKHMVDRLNPQPVIRRRMGDSEKAGRIDRRLISISPCDGIFSRYVLPLQTLHQQRAVHRGRWQSIHKASVARKYSSPVRRSDRRQ